MTEVTEWERSAAGSVDRLVTADLRETGSHNQPDLLYDLYRAAREEEGEPLTLAAARALRERIDPGDTVLLVTGAGAPPWLPYGETDGPPGTVGLAHGLARALGARPVLAIEDRSKAPLDAAVRACGLVSVSYETLRERRDAVSVVSQPEGPEEREAFAREAMATYEPDAVIAVEKLGPNRHGEFPQGEHYVNRHAMAAPLFEVAAERDVLTVGVGDRGNEIGFGRIETDVRRIRDHAPEGACDVATDHLVVGGASNWGAYGIEAMLALLTETPEAMHSPADESRMLDHCSAAGAADATSHLSRKTVDGTSEATQRGIVALLADTVTNRLSTYDKWETRGNEWESEDG
jgi:hypothetical protein